MMRKIALIAAAVIFAATPGMAAPKAAPKAAAKTPANILNTSSSDEANRALKAVTDAGYTSPVIGDVQAGNFSIMATKDGKLLQLRVTPTGQVYANSLAGK